MRQWGGVPISISKTWRFPKRSHLLKQFPSPLTSRTKASPSSNLSLEHSEIFRSKYIYIIMLSAQPIVKFFFLLLSREDFVVLRGGLLLWTTKKNQKDGVVHDNDLTKNNEKLKNIQIVSNSNIFLANGIKHTKQPKRTSLLFLWLTWSSG